MTDSTPASTPRPAQTSWLYRTLALTGIAVGLFVIAAGVYLLVAHPVSAHSPQQDCCKSMEADMKKMMDDPKMPMNKGPMTSMAPMPSMPAMPGPSSMPAMPAPRP
ncbi:hypothetical protein [Mycobacterium sp.]|uniref:hypothetical protein n=1 Tax=Mycobacterium sp. TaxID=1785 RepID=UPI0025E07FA2|nr:hypothetical protein [Mycobacterium sp.]